MRFSKEKFYKYAPVNVRKALKSRLDFIDGLQVDFDFDDKHGTIQYEYKGEKEYLYPVDKKWCKESEE